MCVLVVHSQKLEYISKAKVDLLDTLTCIFIVVSVCKYNRITVISPFGNSISEVYYYHSYLQVQFPNMKFCGNTKMLLKSKSSLPEFHGFNFFECVVLLLFRCLMLLIPSWWSCGWRGKCCWRRRPRWTGAQVHGFYGYLWFFFFFFCAPVLGPLYETQKQKYREKREETRTLVIRPAAWLPCCLAPPFLTPFRSQRSDAEAGRRTRPDAW